MSATTLMSQRDNQLKFESDWKISLEEIHPHLLSRPKETDVIKLLHELSIAFVDRNELLKSYGSKADYVSAYSQVFLPTNAPKLEFLVEQLPSEIRNDFKKGNWQFIDFGCGPGTYSLSWLNLFPNSNCLMIDSANAMLKQAKQLVSGIFGEGRIIDSESKLKEGKRVLFFGNVINEVSEKLAQDLIKKYSPDYVIMIEPGTKASFSQVAKIRQHLLSHDYSIHYPCLSQGACPIAPEGKVVENDWCHQVLRVTHDQSVERLCQLARLDRKIMPMIGHVYSKNEIQTAETSEGLLEGRVVQFLQESKFAFEYRICCFIEGEHKIIHCLLPKKKLSKDQKKDLKKASVGVKFYLNVLKEEKGKIHATLV